MINVSMEIDALARKLAFSQVQTRKLMAVVLTKVAYSVQAAIQDEMRRTFDRPTSFVLRSVYVRQAKIQGDAVSPATIGIRGSVGGKVSPAHVLFAQVQGGTRRTKAGEELLNSRLPGFGRGGNGQWIPGAGAKLDAHGNVPGSEWKRYVSALQAARDQGVTSNSLLRGTTGLTRAQVKQIKTLQDTRRRGDENLAARRIAMIQAQKALGNAKTQVGTFFLGPAKGASSRQPSVLYQFRWAQRQGKRTPNNINPSPVWSKTNVRPVLVATNPQAYRPRILIGDIAKRVAAQDLRKIADQEAMRLFSKWNGAK